VDGGGLERPVRGEVLVEADSDDIGSLLDVVWQPTARRQGTTWGVDVGDGRTTPVTLVEVVHRQRQKQAE
jgi:hypothetical protein